MATLGTFAAGQVLTAAELNDIGTWTTYTPSFSGLGFSAYTARYTEINNVVHVWFHGTVNSDTATFEIGMPTAMLPGTTDGAPIGTVYGFDLSLSYFHEGFVVTRTADAVRFVTGSGASWGTWSTTYPMNWAVGDILAFTCTYEKGAP
jgi:hypothetical protein